MLPTHQPTQSSQSSLPPILHAAEVAALPEYELEINDNEDVDSCLDGFCFYVGPIIIIIVVILLCIKFI